MKFLIPLLPLFLALFACNPWPGENASMPELVHNMNDSSWYQRKCGTTQYLLEIKYGDPRISIQHAHAQGEDAEAYYVLAVAHTKLNDIDSAMYYLQKATEAGLPKERFVAGPYPFFENLYNSQKYQKWVQKQDIKLVHGPMLGNVFDTKAIFWARTAGESDVQFVLSADRSFNQPVYSSRDRARFENGHAVQILVEGLAPDSDYYYKLIIDDQELTDVYSFKTQPSAYQSAEFEVAFGGGAAYIPWYSHMWTSISSHNLNGLFMLGDNVYIDYPEHPYIQEYCYHQRQSEQEWREMVSHTPIYAIWDDHDFADNDDYGGPKINEPAWKTPVWETFKDQWANISYGFGREQPGVWFDFNIADVDFFMLDGRYYREGSNVDDTTSNLSMLGPVQKEWLKESLLNSNAAFKVIASPVPWSYAAKGGMEGRYDHWRGYKNERDEIFDFIYDNNIEGVVLISADRHRSDLWMIERENGYPMYEFESSKLTNTHTHRCLHEAEFCYNGKNSFGKMVFNTDAVDPYLVYEIWNIDNEKVFEKKITKSELRN
ncbi:MAG: alkaline phosphatase D family protein [Bacteroidales bacterium]